MENKWIAHFGEWLPSDNSEMFQFAFFILTFLKDMQFQK